MKQENKKGIIFTVLIAAAILVFLIWCLLGKGDNSRKTEQGKAVGQEQGSSVGTTGEKGTGDCGQYQL